ncbi:hypothetical protein DL771_000717 [Monosporascus sp. 5C6A]|nr:hypothetical protein DL771_000717 [Monosporascus sp. 5C6A]
MSKVSYINDFIREGIGDYDLPIARSRDDNKEFKTRRGAKNSTLFRGWRHRNDIELFYIYQKKIFVPFFDIQEDKLCSYMFEGNVTLPWKGYKQKTSGGNGLVHKVQIHSKHHNFKTPIHPEKPLYFALKEISALDRDAYRRELWALEKSALRTQKKKHLIKLLLTFQHGDVCYLLFEWADGNLAEFWEQPDITPAPSDTWAVKQCLGISSAIKRIHGLTTWQKERRSSLGSESEDEREWGRHGDIKPNNILWFSVYGNDPHHILRHHLVVSDLGLTRYHSRHTRSAVYWFDIDGCTWAYRPPEMDMEHKISQKYDIWSLGCVFLEFCIWYVEGGEAVQIFGLERTSQDKSEIENVEEDKYFNVTTDHQGRRTANLKPIVKEIPSDSRPSMEPDALQTDSLVQHAQGNSVGVLAIDWQDRSAAKYSSATTDQPEQDTRLQNTRSKGTQTTFDNAQFVTADPQTAATGPRPGWSVHGEVGIFEAIETPESRSIALMNADLMKAQASPE